MTADSCAVEGCEREMGKGGRGYCGMHYQRVCKTGDPGPVDAVRGKNVPGYSAFCTIDGCGRKSYARNLCSFHYQRQQKGIPMDARIVFSGENKPLVCTVKGCDQPSHLRGLCAKHYSAQQRAADPGARQRIMAARGLCVVDGCSEPIFVLRTGLCAKHTYRVRVGMDLNRPDCRSIMFNGRNVSYSGAHGRVAALWGAASQYACIGCGKTARDWAYDGADPDELYGRSNKDYWSKYSAWPEFYAPMCVKCHSSKDAALMAAELKEYRMWKQATRLTVNNIPFPESYTPTEEERQEAEELLCPM